MRNGVNTAYVVTPTKFRPLKMPVTPQFHPTIFPTEENLSLVPSFTFFILIKIISNRQLQKNLFKNFLTWLSALDYYIYQCSAACFLVSLDNLI